MSLRTPRSIFGIHQVSPYNIETGEFYGTLKVLASSSLSLSGEQIKLSGGSNKFDWATESGKITAEMSLKFKEYPAFVFELFFGKKATETLIENAEGEVGGFTNKAGGSIKDAANGVASVGVIPTSGAADLKFGLYVLKAVDASTLKVYHSTDIDHNRGATVEYDTDMLDVATIDLSTETDIESLGLRFVKVGTPAFDAGDTAEFYVYPPYNEKLEVVVGSPSDVTPEFGAFVVAEKRSDKGLIALDVFRCKATGLPIGMEAKAFSEAEAKVSCLFDPAKNGVFKFMSLKPSF